MGNYEEMVQIMKKGCKLWGKGANYEERVQIMRKGCKLWEIDEKHA